MWARALEHLLVLQGRAHEWVYGRYVAPRSYGSLREGARQALLVFRAQGQQRWA